MKNRKVTIQSLSAPSIMSNDTSNVTGYSTARAPDALLRKTLTAVPETSRIKQPRPAPLSTNQEATSEGKNPIIWPAQLCFPLPDTALVTKENQGKQTDRLVSDERAGERECASFNVTGLMSTQTLARDHNLCQNPLDNFWLLLT